MTLAPGSRIGPYEVTGTLGVGGMGEVYRARDSRLGRDVALKVLPASFAADPERLARFQREAQVLASLKHPNIGAIYGLEEGVGEGGVRLRALVLELVDGDTLAERLGRGSRLKAQGLSLEEALPIAKQIAEALAAAHEQGVVHRDLKPSNIKVTGDGFVKVLDFGLAKLTDSTGSGPAAGGDMAALSASPTLMSPAMMSRVRPGGGEPGTMEGALLGTAAYMSPEQAKGQAADKRSDVWSFGCVLYETFTGKRAFEADDISDTLALVLKGEPDWAALPADVPVSVQTLIRACLVKDRRQRLADIAGAVFVLSHQSQLASSVVAPSSQSAPAPRLAAWRRFAAVAAPVLATAALTGTGVWWAVRSEPSLVTSFFVAPPENATFLTGGRPAASVAISPDGRTLAFTARDAAGKVMLWVRPIDSLAAKPLAGTDDARFPFWSPDSRFLSYFTQDKLLKVSANGGPPQLLCDVTEGRGGTWSREGQIVYGSNSGSLFRVSSAGGQSTAITRIAAGQQDHRFPSFLPDARHVLYFAIAPPVGGTQSRIFVTSLDTGETQPILEADSGGVYDSRNGYLLFTRQGTLLEQPFDLKTLAITGEPFPVAQRLEWSVFGGIAAFSVSNDGTLAYGIGSGGDDAGLQMVWVDRQGKAVGTVGPAGNYRGLDLSPDGTRVAAHRHDGGRAGDVWVTEVARGTTTRFTFDASQDNSSPNWSPDGNRIVYASTRGLGKYGLISRPSNGAGGEERLLESQVPLIAGDWAPDGRSVIYTTVDPKTRGDVWVLPLYGNRQAVPLAVSPFNEDHPQVSPDGKWLAYQSDETGQSQIYVRPFPGGTGKWQISAGGEVQGFSPRWRPDGRELLFMDSVTYGKLMAVDVRTNGSAFEAGTPRALFDSGYVNLGGHPGPFTAYAVSADGQRFLIPRPVASATQETSPPIAVVLNWAQGVGR